MYYAYLSGTLITEGHGYHGDPKGYKSWVPDCPHVLDKMALNDPARRDEYIKKFVRKLQARKAVILNRGRTLITKLLHSIFLEHLQ